MSRPLRSGPWTPSLWAASLIQNQDFQAAAPRTKKAANETNVRRLICCWMGCAGSRPMALRNDSRRGGRGFLFFMDRGVGGDGRGGRIIDDVEAGDHCAEIVPAREDDLDDMDHKKQAVA